ncbi:MAG: isoprenylcysteine carboxylmethyltransferase family protein [Chloroflexi bacterium]|nr:isoprenylcysteine carboxylmethyltransferase family protein [Chloroflexota bacterium]
MNFAILIGSIALWGCVHSWLASLRTKDFLARVVGKSMMRIYRLAYNIFSVLSFAPILLLARFLPDQNLYSIPAPWLFLTLTGQGLSALLLLIGVLQTDALSFAGLRQLFEPDEKADALTTGGLYRLVRHPLYLFGLLFIWLTPIMTVNMLIVYVSLTIYIFIGAYFEERKLLREFGQAYADYKSRTPMIIPGWILRR